MVLSCIISKIKRFLKNRDFIYPLHSMPPAVRGVSLRNIAITFGATQCNRRADRQTSCDGRVRAIHKHRATRGKNVVGLRVYQIDILFMQSQGKVVFKRGRPTMCNPGTNFKGLWGYEISPILKNGPHLPKLLSNIKWDTVYMHLHCNRVSDTQMLMALVIYVVLDSTQTTARLMMQEKCVAWCLLSLIPQSRSERCSKVCVCVGGGG